MTCKVCLNYAVEHEFCSVCIAVYPKLKKFHTLSSSIDALYSTMDTYRRQLSGKSPLVIGLSGGVDSTLIATVAADLKLPLRLIHFDNGWNTSLAVANINKILDKFDLPIDTFVQDWNVFKSLQRSFLFSGVPDLELISDHAIFALMSNYLDLNNYRFVVSGANFTTEHGLNLEYGWNKLDYRNIKAINEAYENIDLRDYPNSSTLRWAIDRALSRKRKVLLPLNSFYYKRSAAIAFLSEKISFADYEFKHEESLITKVYQRLILPKKYNYFKVEDHVNALVRNKEITKLQATYHLQSFKDSGIDAYELQYFKDKLELSDRDWGVILGARKRHSDFKNSQTLYKGLQKMSSILKMSSMS